METVPAGEPRLKLTALLPTISQIYCIKALFQGLKSCSLQQRQEGLPEARGLECVQEAGLENQDFGELLFCFHSFPLLPSTFFLSPSLLEAESFLHNSGWLAYNFFFFFCLFGTGIIALGSFLELPL